MIKIFCDRCKKEITSEDLNIIKINDEENIEICKDCLNKVKDYINENSRRKILDD